MLWLHHYREVAHLRSHNWPSNSPHRLVFSRISDPRHRHQSEDWITPPPRRPRRSAACQHSKILPDICFVGRFHGLCIAACMLLSIFGRHGTGGRETVQPPTLFLDPFGAEREHFANSSLSKSEAHDSEKAKVFERGGSVPPVVSTDASYHEAHSSNQILIPTISKANHYPQPPSHTISLFTVRCTKHRPRPHVAPQSPAPNVRIHVLHTPPTNPTAAPASSQHRLGRREPSELAWQMQPATAWLNRRGSCGMQPGRVRRPTV
jgi:hypothetical protein